MINDSKEKINDASFKVSDAPEKYRKWYNQNHRSTQLRRGLDNTYFRNLQKIKYPASG